MLFLMEFQEELLLSPSVLSKNIKGIIKAKLIEKVQGSVSEKNGYIICVISIDNIPNGTILDTSGDILFNVKYQAVVMKPFSGEVCEGVVDKVDRYGIMVYIGPIEVFISKDHFPPGFKFHEQNKFYISPNNGKIEVYSEVRFRIQAVQFKANEFKLTATMAENYLGLL